MRRSTSLAAISLVALAGALAACGESSTSPAHPSASAAPPVEPSVPVVTLPGPDAGARAALSDGGAYDGPVIGALFLTTPVMSDMGWPAHDGDPHRRGRDRDPESKSVVLGYIRQGARVPVIPEPHEKPNCREGWYELLAGGFVCGKYASMDMNHPRIKIAPHPPNMEGPLPYDYGVNMTNGTPLYRTVPSREDRVKFEPWLTRKPKPKPVDDSSTNPYATSDSDLDAGLTPASLTSATDPFGVVAVEDASVPWYLREYDGGKPQITLDDLVEDGGPIARRMVKGFYLALDKEWKDPHNVKWWRTTGGLLAPFDRVYVAKPATNYHGVWLKDGEALAPSTSGDAGPNSIVDAAGSAEIERKPVKDPSAVGFILWFHAHKWNVSADKKKVTQGDAVPRFTIARLTGEKALIGGYWFEETDEGWWMRANEMTRTMPGPAPRDLKPGEKWIDVNLTTQTLLAYEGDKPVFATIVSSGKRNLQVPEKDHATPKGTFRIREKHIAATMDGDVASDGPYSIEDVPWIMYFSGSYALHGAFWHQNFGHTQSHGCVNLSPEDARELFGWTEPQLPQGWHGVVSTEQKPGTRVVVHD